MVQLSRSHEQTRYVSICGTNESVQFIEQHAMMQARSIVSKDCGKHVAGKLRECAPEALAACVRVVARHEKKKRVVFFFCVAPTSLRFGPLAASTAIRLLRDGDHLVAIVVSRVVGFYFRLHRSHSRLVSEEHCGSHV